MNARVEAEDNQELALQNMKLRSQLATKRFSIFFIALAAIVWQGF